MTKIRYNRFKRKLVTHEETVCELEDRNHKRKHRNKNITL